MTSRSNGTRTKGPRRPRTTPRKVDWVVLAANEYIVRHYPVGALGGTPRRLRIDSRDLWMVPIVLTSPGYGAVGEVGMVAIDAATREVAGSTPRSEVVVASKGLREAKRDELEAAFRRARTG